MQITVRFFAILKDRAGTSEATLDLPTESNVAAAIEEVCNRYPSIRADLSRAAIAVNRTYSKSNAILHNGDELAMIPPVSGG